MNNAYLKLKYVLFTKFKEKGIILNMFEFVLMSKAKSLIKNEWIYGYPFIHIPVSYCMMQDKPKNEVYILSSGFSDWGLPKPIIMDLVKEETICRITEFNYDDETKSSIYEHDEIEYTICGKETYHGYVSFKNGCIGIESNDQLEPFKCLFDLINTKSIKFKKLGNKYD